MKRWFFAGVVLWISTFTATAEVIDNGRKYVWEPFDADFLHDPANPALDELQHPEEAFRNFPKDTPTIGNQVDWVRALEQGFINPRTNLFPDTEIEVLDLDIIMPDTADMPMVRFPHRAHTQWLDCSNCHDHLFAREAGATPVNMFSILSGEYCGRCHGAVSFPLTECRRCHSVNRSRFRGKPGAQQPPGRIYEPVLEQPIVR
ncbi:c(7)-type cytochrome triheme domain-containing protein [Motiliproteus sp. SC1-56]|uniref:c(7)-type cytochrome triheme domain-containing protein n=1 Tax=Motiliproteus sp. SC1-56 TaxID=2799565 RepID=UPI001A8DE2EE|nr:c(7)-type cytochrome triheme domain-containing protein [Motiliproteus sp. SC1-56]